MSKWRENSQRDAAGKTVFIGVVFPRDGVGENGPYANTAITDGDIAGPSEERRHRMTEGAKRDADAKRTRTARGNRPALPRPSKWR